MNKVFALIVAGGRGKRIGGNRAKQFLSILGKPVLFHTILPFEKSSFVSEIILVVPKGYENYVKNEIVGRYKFGKVKEIICGGKSRQDSVYKGLKTIEMREKKPEIVVIHDGVRPLVSQGIVEKSVIYAKKYGAVVVAIPVSDSVFQGKGKQRIMSLDRKYIFFAQTPQAFRWEMIKKAYEKAKRMRFYGTDDASLVEKSGNRVYILEGNYDNLKVTRKIDLKIAEILLLLRKQKGRRSQKV